MAWDMSVRDNGSTHHVVVGIWAFSHPMSGMAMLHRPLLAPFGEVPMEAISL